MISQYAENVFFGKPCGLMDQTACAVGKVITIDFKEVGHPVVREVPFDLAAKGFALCISDTKGSHADLTDDYAAVRREMESVAEFFGKKVLRDVDEETFLKAIPEVRKVTGDRAVVRAIHFYNDSRRAGEIYEAIKGMITDMVSCIKELTLQGIAVKIDDLAIFSIGIRNKEGAASEKEFTIAKNIDGFRLRARGTGEFSAKTINLDATLKKATALLGDGTTPDTDKGTTGGDNTDQGGSGTTGGDNTSQGGSGTTGGDNTDQGGSGTTGGDNVNF